MRRWLIGLSLVALLALLHGLDSTRESRLIHSGDRITPQLAWALDWTAGEEADLGIRLHAQGQKDTKPRLLDCAALPFQVYPVAHVSFWDDYQELETLDVSLTPRC